MDISLDQQIKKDKQTYKSQYQNQSNKYSNRKYIHKYHKYYRNHYNSNYHHNNNRRGGGNYRDNNNGRYTNYHNNHKSYNNFNNHGYHNNNYHSNHYSLQKSQKTCIKITKLHYAVTIQQLQGICQKIGPIKSCNIDWDKMGRSNQTATVQYQKKQDAQLAQKELNQMTIQGQNIQVQLGYPINEMQNNDYGNSSKMPMKRHLINKNFRQRQKYHHHNNYNNSNNKYRK